MGCKWADNITVYSHGIKQDNLLRYHGLCAGRKGELWSTLCQNLFLIIDSPEDPSSKFSVRNPVCLKVKKKKKSLHYKFVKEWFGYQTMTRKNYVSIICAPGECIIFLLSHLNVIKSRTAMCINQMYSSFEYIYSFKKGER